MTAFRSTTFARGGDEVETRLRARYGDYRVRDPDATMHDDIVATPFFLLNRASFAGSVDVTLVGVRHVSLGGATGVCRWRTGDERGDAAHGAYLVTPEADMHVHLGDSVGSGISFAVDALERTAQRMFADDGLQVRFAGHSPRSASDGRYLREMTQFVVAEREAALESDLVAASMYRHAAALLLEHFPLRQDPRGRPASPRSLLAGYRRAMTDIDDRAHLPITVEDVAEAAGLPTAQLEAAFRWHSPTGGSVSDHLRRVRLACAHRDLLAGRVAEGDTVATIAFRWGFRPRTFVDVYRATYRAEPSAILSGEHTPSSAPTPDPPDEALR